MSDIELNDFEIKYVKNVYDNIAEDFSRTRYKHWSYTEKYLKSINNPSKILEVGCGNGKNFCVDIHDYYGIDISKELIKYVPDKYKNNVRYGNALNLPYDDDSFDHVMSIAVIHHLSNKYKRLKALEEMYRVLKKGGTMIFSVWAFDKNDKKRDKSDKMVRFKKRNGDIYYRYYNMSTEEEFRTLVDMLIKKRNITLEKLDFEKQNYYAIMKKIS